MEWTQEKIDQLYRQIQTKAMTDKAFHEAILKDANQAIEQEFGIKLPEGTMLKAIEQDPAYTATFVIPDLVTDELTAEQLDQASGGEQDLGVSGVLVLSVCAVAVGYCDCTLDNCGGYVCTADTIGCPVDNCGAKATVL